MGNQCCTEGDWNKEQWNRKLMSAQVNRSEVKLSQGSVLHENVQCFIIPTDEKLSNIPKHLRPTSEWKDLRVLLISKQGKNLILVKSEECHTQFNVNSSQSVLEKQSIFETLTECLHLAEEKNYSQIGIGAFPVRDGTISATIMLMTINVYLTEQTQSKINRICIAIDDLAQKESYEWVFTSIFKVKNVSIKSYHSSVGSHEMNALQASRLST